jgi:transcriptional regulator with XRE-family HTH domain
MALSDSHSVRVASASAERLRERIVSLRKQRNLSQRDIAQALGITDQTVSNWEQGRSEPRLTIRQVVLLCRILDCSLTDLDDGEDL